ncbi:hypothetical protein FRC00_009694, partial [Tulasnella sp. 408]
YSQCVPAESTTTTTTPSSSSSKTTTTTTTSSTTTTTTTTTSSTTTTTTTTSSSSTSKTSTTTSTPVPTATPKYWFSFGDSYTATVGLCKTLLGYTACGFVTNWIDEMIVQFNESHLYAYNFAYGGATIDATIVEPYTSTVLSMTDQMNQFLANLSPPPSYAPWTSSDSIFSFFIGINDVGECSTPPSRAEMPEFSCASPKIQAGLGGRIGATGPRTQSYHSTGNLSDLLPSSISYTGILMDAYFALVQKAYDAGARNFLFVNVPCVERSPYVLGLGTAEEVGIPMKTAIDGYNAELINRVNAFKTANSGVTAWIYDSNTRLGQILDAPTSYGFQDGTTYGSGSNLAWCNDFHVSPGVHHYFAQDVAGVLSGSGF